MNESLKILRREAGLETHDSFLHTPTHQDESFDPAVCSTPFQSGCGSGDRQDRQHPWVDKHEPPTRTNYRMIVENLSSKVSGQDLKDMMRRNGEVTYANAHNDHRNEGIVEFVNKHDLERALNKYNGYKLHGRKLKVFKDRDVKSGSRSRIRSTDHKDRSHSRSRSKIRYRPKYQSSDRKRSKSDHSRSKSRDDRSRSKDRNRENRSRSKGKHEEQSRSKRCYKISQSKDQMRHNGDVTYANDHNDHHNEGIVELVNKHDLERTLNKYNGYKLHGRKLKVFKDRDVKSGSRSRSRSKDHKDRLRSRSRSNRLHRSKSRSRDRKRSKSDRSRSKSRDDRSRSKDRNHENRSRSKGKREEQSRFKSCDISRSTFKPIITSTPLRNERPDRPEYSLPSHLTYDSSSDDVNQPSQSCLPLPVPTLPPLPNPAGPASGFMSGLPNPVPTRHCNKQTNFVPMVPGVEELSDGVYCHTHTFCVWGMCRGV